MDKLKIIFIGPTNVGKTYIINKIINNEKNIIPSKKFLYLDIININSNDSLLFKDLILEKKESSEEIFNFISNINEDNYISYNNYILYTCFKNFQESLSNEIIIKDTPGYNQINIDYNYYFHKINNSNVIYYIFTLNQYKEQIYYFTNILKNIRENIINRMYNFKIIINKCNEENINNINNYFELEKIIKEQIKEIINTEYLNEFIYINFMENKNIISYNKSILNLFKNIENDLINNGRINGFYMEKIVDKIKEKIYLKFNEEELKIKINDIVYNKTNEIFNKICISEKKIKEILNNNINENSENEFKIFIINLILHDDKINNYPINIVFKYYYKFFILFFNTGYHMAKILFLLKKIYFNEISIIYNIFGNSLINSILIENYLNNLSDNNLLYLNLNDIKDNNHYIYINLNNFFDKKIKIDARYNIYSNDIYIYSPLGKLSYHAKYINHNYIYGKIKEN